MSKRLENKKIVVTAAGQGIGRATAIAFHNEGANVIATDINDKTLETLNKEYPNIKVKNLDSTNKKAIEEFSASLERVNVYLMLLVLFIMELYLIAMKKIGIFHLMQISNQCT